MGENFTVLWIPVSGTGALLSWSTMMLREKQSFPCSAFKCTLNICFSPFKEFQIFKCGTNCGPTVAMKEEDRKVSKGISMGNFFF